MHPHACRPIDPRRGNVSASSIRTRLRGGLGCGLFHKFTGDCALVQPPSQKTGRGGGKKYKEDELRPHRMNWAWLIACALAWPTLSAAQEWPARPIRVIVPVSAGSAIDLVSRAVFDQLA